MKKILKVSAVLVAAVLVLALVYVAYACLTYYRLEDGLALSVENNPTAAAVTGQDYTLLTYNVGFGAYSADYSFFMDGGTESRAYSKEAVQKNLTGALTAAVGEKPDFLLLQELDVDATRSYHVDQSVLARAALPALGGVYAQNYDSPYLLWPLTSPHGASKAGMMTFTACHAESALRRRLPVETGFTKFLDLDRCYTLTRIPVEGGGTLCLYNVHLSAYTSDGRIATQQLQLLLADMAGEVARGNYAVCGGDFNKDLLGDSSAIFGVSGAAYTWAQPFPAELLPPEVALAAPLDAANPVPSCRNADAPYDPPVSFVLTVDGFLVSGNVTVRSAQVLDTGFSSSDHNPVKLV
ncbi:MAG: endonuclease/exonuclease/phosphatase family protein, partial [Oscillibacter sp.]